MRRYRACWGCGWAGFRTFIRGWVWLAILGSWQFSAMRAETRSAGTGAGDGGIIRSTAVATQGCLRLIVDRALGLRWRMESQGPGRPNRLVPVGEGDRAACAGGTDRKQQDKGSLPVQSLEGGKSIRSATQPGGTQYAAPQQETSNPPIAVHPVIQVGEAIVVVQSGKTVEARFPAVAMAAATAGAWLPVRLQVGNGSFGRLGGHLIRVQAVAAGLARWDGQQMGAGW